MIQEDEEELEGAMLAYDKCAENIELYDKIVELGPRQFIDDFKQAMEDAGEELEADEGEERNRQLVERALSRNLTPEEEQMKERLEQNEVDGDEVLSQDKQ